MSNRYFEIIRRHCRPMEPIPTRTEAWGDVLDDIRAVLFDVYGTLLVSGSGDVGTARETAREDAWRDALVAVGVPRPAAEHESVEQFFAAISRRHEAARQRGIEFPEVDVVDVWAEILASLSDRDVEADDCRRAALEYEVRVNPVWPMPGLQPCLGTLRESGIVLGIVSNAQFYTPLLFGALAGTVPDALGFDRELQFFSYEWKQAKPGTFLYARAAAALAERDIAPHQVLYVGNDMRNDIWPAGQVGFRTALFAGDRRSLRLREEDPEVCQVLPDVVVTALDQLSQCLGLS